jgi:hypothetical protein
VIPTHISVKPPHGTRPKAHSLEFLLFDSDKELPDTFQGQFITLDQDPDRVGHELGRHLEHIVGQSGGKNDDLGRGRQVSVNVVDLVLETLVEQLVGFIEDEHLDVLGAERSSTDHVEHTAGRAGHDVLSVLELLDVLADTGAADTGVALDVHVVSQGKDDVLDLDGQFSCGRENEGLAFSDGGIDRLEDRDTERRGLTGTGLSLGDDVSAGDDGQDGSLLDSGGLLEVCERGIVSFKSGMS